jgi:hypothetical protein
MARPLAVLAWGLLLVGCGPRVGQVTGKVRYKGEVLRSGTVQFHGADGQVRVSPIGKDGSYRVSDVAVGTARITVHGQHPNPFVRVEKVKLPARYESVDTSGLTCAVRPGKQDHDINMGP